MLVYDDDDGKSKDFIGRNYIHIDNEFKYHHTKKNIIIELV